MILLIIDTCIEDHLVLFIICIFMEIYNNMRKLLYVMMILGFNIYGQGLIFTPADKLSEYDEFPSESYGFSTTYPSSFSLEKYVPPVLNQNGGTCVGFSTFYYGLSTMYNKKFNITDNNSKYAHSFDPYFLYSLYFSDVNNCENGLPFDAALGNLKKVGAKKLMFPPFTTCNQDWNETDLGNIFSYTKPYGIKEWYTVFTNKPDFLNTIKKLIYEGIPVIVGMTIDDTMQPYRSDNPTGIKSDGLWNPGLSEKKDGHALCVIGYDNYKYGGAFRIVNSWGRDYGDNGYIWVRYSDFKSYTKEAHVFELNENIVTRPPVIIESDDYKRYKYKTAKNNYSSYEGQYLNNSVSGYGIWGDKDNDTFYIGKFSNGDMSGFFLVLDEDGLYSANGVNGELQDLEKLGFAENQETLETQLKAKKFFSLLGTDMSIRKANSTKINKPRSNGKN